MQSVGVSVSESVQPRVLFLLQVRERQANLKPCHSTVLGPSSSKAFQAVVVAFSSAFPEGETLPLRGESYSIGLLECEQDSLKAERV